MNDFITLAHGSGGRLTGKLVRDIFFKYFNNSYLTGEDSALLELPAGKTAFTTDSFVISPIFFRGGNIGKLAVCGTVNDLAAAGSKPLYLTCGFIIEEGFPIPDLERIAASMAETAAASGVRIVAGDTKVVGKGAADKIFINTAGIGAVIPGTSISSKTAAPGDSVIITGTVGDHGCSILLEREKLGINADISSDCAPMNILTEKVLEADKGIRVLRDPTRGGLATALNEIASDSHIGILLEESRIPVRPEVQGVCELLGMDPIYLANEGKMIIIAPSGSEDRILEVLHSEPNGRNAAVIGRVVAGHPGRVVMKTPVGSRIVDMLAGDQLPRIC